MISYHWNLVQVEGGKKRLQIIKFQPQNVHDDKAFFIYH